MTFSKHTAVLSGFRQHFIKTRIFRLELSDIYKVAFDTRQISDYDLTTQLDAVFLQKNIKEARTFVNEAEKWLKQNNFLFD